MRRMIVCWGATGFSGQRRAVGRLYLSDYQPRGRIASGKAAQTRHPAGIVRRAGPIFPGAASGRWPEMEPAVTSHSDSPGIDQA